MPGKRPMVKSLIMATPGIFVSLIAKDNRGGFSRFTFGTITLSDGVGLILVGQVVLPCILQYGTFVEMAI